MKTNINRIKHHLENMGIEFEEGNALYTGSLDFVNGYCDILLDEDNQTECCLYFRKSKDGRTTEEWRAVPFDRHANGLKIANDIVARILKYFEIG